VAKGRRVYLSNCTACHNLDPSKKGSLGPAVSNSSRALIEARVVHGNYPPGYKPKMDTRLMVALPYLKKDVPALSAYLEN
jgi:mono/diheme cytochrome c family protein